MHGMLGRVSEHLPSGRAEAGLVVAGLAAEGLLVVLVAHDVPPFQSRGVPGAVGVMIATLVAIGARPLAGVVVAGAGALGFAASWDMPWYERLAPVGLWMAAAGLVGYAVCREQVRRRAAEVSRHGVLGDMLRAEQDQRRQLAADLHDDTIQVLAAVLLRLDVARRAGANATGHIALTMATLQEALERTRRMTFELRPPLLSEGGLPVALPALLIETCDEIGCAAHHDVDVGRYPDAVEELVYRTVREALVNARKHAKPHNVWLRATDAGEELDVEIRDDGRGFHPNELDAAALGLHMGLAAMRERIRLAGGNLTIDAAAGRGTAIRFRVPITTITSMSDRSAVTSSHAP